ncbi:MAG: hypothetical protein R3Y11_09695 [Pseudomonadota bacterium]
MRNILVKVYGSVHPLASEEKSSLIKRLELLLDDDAVDFSGDMVRISFEGMYFPIDEVLEIIQEYLHAESQGRIDYIDMDAWRLHRHLIEGTTITEKSNNLNNILDYAGH